MLYMNIKIIEGEFSLCQVKDYTRVDLGKPFTFAEKTDEENSLVCLTENVPALTLKREAIGGPCGLKGRWIFP